MEGRASDHPWWAFCMENLLHTIAGKIAILFSSATLLFSGALAHNPAQPTTQAVSAIVAVVPTEQTQTVSTTSTPIASPNVTRTIVHQYLPAPATKSATPNVPTPAIGYVTQEAFTTAINELADRFGRIISGSTYPAPATNWGSGGVWNTIAAMNKIDHLSGTSLSDITVDGVSGLTASDIPTLNYLSSTGGTVSGLSSFTNASTSLFSVFNNALFGSTATSSFDSTGALTLATPLALTSGGTGGTSSTTARNNLGLSYASSADIVNQSSIATWGDSLTSGTGGNTSYPTQLTTLSGYAVYNGGVGGEGSTQIKTRMLAATDKHSWPTIIWAGRNNYTDPTTVKADIAAMVAALGHENYIILGVLNGDYGGYEILGGGGYIQITQLNSDLSTIYGSHFIDIRAYLVSQYDSGSPQDVTDHTNDTVPTSLRSDAIHLNTAGYLKVAQKIYDNIYILQSGSQTALTPANIQYFFSNPPTIGRVTPGLAYFSTAIVNTKLGVGSSTPTDMVSVTVPNTANANSGITLDRNSGQNAFGFRLKSDASGLYRGALIGKRNGNLEIEPLTVGLDTNYGNIGIGTTTPWRTLSVNGSSDLGTNALAGYFTGTSATATSTFAGGVTGPNNFVVQQTSGNVGIRTTNPLSALNVAGTTGITWNTTGLSSGLATIGTGGNVGGSLFVNTASFNSTTDYNSGLGITGSYNDPTKKSVINLNAYGVKVTNYSSDMALSTTNNTTLSEVMRLTSSGNVGIGTSTPSQKLSVAGSGYFDGNITASNLTAIGTANIAGKTTLTTFTASNGTTTSATSTNLFSTNSTITNATSTNSFSTTASSTNLFTSSFSLGSISGFLKATAGSVTNALVNLATDITGILGLANGGTGASTLTGLLQGNGTSAITGITGTAGQFPYYNGANTLSATSSIFLTSSGNVGIGTTTPGNLLTMQATNPNIQLSTNSGAPGVMSSISHDSLGFARTSVGFGTITGGQGFMSFLTGSGSLSETMRIVSGKVGIGTSTPLTNLTIYTGNSANANEGISLTRGPYSENVFGFRLKSDGGGVYRGAITTKQTTASEIEALTVSYLGNVGIGTTVPTHKLEVGGSFLANGAAHFLSNVGIGTTTPTSKFTVQQTSGGNYIDNDGITISNRFGGISDTRFQLTANGSTVLGLPSGNDGGALSLASANDQSVISGAGAGIAALKFFVSNLTTPKMTITNAGNVGIGTTTPWRTLSVTGTVGFDGLTGSTGAGSLCLDANKQVVYNSGSDSCLSSTRATKHDILPLDLSALDMVESLQPVSFVYNNDASSTVRYGFIAEDAAAVDPHFATHDQAGVVSGIDDRSIISVLVRAIQELGGKIASILDRLAGHDAKIAALEARLAALENGQIASVTASQNSNSTVLNTEPPTIEINGNNPAHIAIGSTYSDLGATITGPTEADKNLGIQTFVDATPLEFAVIDTSAPATYHIYYVATNSYGTATSSRTVIVDAADTSTTDAMTTDTAASNTTTTDETASSTPAN